MSSLSIETIDHLLKIAFWVGAITDAFAILPMLSRRVGVALFGGDSNGGKDEYRFAMGIGASLMAGWTLLLLWGSANPIERRALLLLTICPVITGIVIASVIAARRGVVLRSRLIPLWIHLGVVSIFYGVVYALSSSLVR